MARRLLPVSQHVPQADGRQFQFCGPSGLCPQPHGNARGQDGHYAVLSTDKLLLQLVAIRPRWINAAAGRFVGLRWYELRSPGGTPTVYQQGTFAPGDGNYRWLGSIAMDQVGDIALGYNVSGSNLNPAIRHTGRVPSDALGAMEAEANIFQGAGSQTSGLSRWGDYSSMSIDPVDDCTFWYVNQYIPSNGAFNWATHIYSFKFPSCGATAAPAAPSGLVATAGNAQVSLAWTSPSGATSYNVLRSTTNGGPYSLIATNVTGASMTDSGLT